MNNKKLFNLLIIVLISFLVLNMVFLALRIISEFFFWIIIIIIGIFAYKYVPKIKK